MRHGVNTCAEPRNQGAIYMRNMYHKWFWGPFQDEQEVVEAIMKLDKADPYWDYDPFCMIYGLDPLPNDFVFGFPFVPDEIKERIILSARPKTGGNHET